MDNSSSTVTVNVKEDMENLIMEALSLLQEIEAIGEEGFNLESDGPKYLEKLKDIVNRFDKVAPNELGKDIFADLKRLEESVREAIEKGSEEE